MTRSLDIPTLLLAAGQSRRMGGTDKLLHDVGGVTLLRHQIDTSLAARAGPVLVVLPPEPHPRYAVVEPCDVQIVPAPDSHLGMSASLRAGLMALPAGTKAAMILLADLPDLTSADLAQVCRQVNPDSGTLVWRGATAEGAPGHPVVVAAALFPALMALQGDSGGAEVLSAHRHETELIRLPGTHARRDLDTPEDWAAWRQDNNR